MKKLIALLSAVLVAVVLVVPAFAADTDFDYTKINGGTTKLHKYLVVEKNVNSPKITFNYSIAAGTAVAPTGTGGETGATLPVYAGPTPNLVKIGDAAGDEDGKVAFAAGAATTAGTATDGITNSTEKKYGSKDIFIDFSAVEFDKPGVYRYILTEAASNDEGLGGVTYDVMEGNNLKRTIDVYVEDNNGTLRMMGYVSYVGDSVSTAPLQEYDPNGASTDGYANGSKATDATGLTAKSNQYVNEIKFNELTLEKDITGNQGDKESKWEMKVKFETLPDGYKVKYAQVKDKGTDIPEAQITWADYTNEAAITLGYKDQYKFKGIPEGVKYTVTETKANQDGYKTTYTNQTYTYPSDTNVETKDAKVENNRTGVIPTGVAVGIISGIALLGLVAAYFIVRRKLASR